MKKFYKFLAPLLILATFAVFIPHDTAFAAVTIDNSVSTSSLAGPGTNTVSYTVGSITNGLLILSTQSTFITSITYDGVAMSLGTTTGAGFALYYLLNPDIGTHNLVVTRSNGITDAGFASIASFGNVSQTNPFTNANHQRNTAAASTLSNNFTTLTNGSIVLDTVELESSPGSPVITITATGSNHTSGAYGYSGGGNQSGDGLGYTTTTTAGSNTIGYTWNGITVTWIMDYYELLPSPPPTTPQPIVLIKGANAIIKGGNVTIQ